MKIFTVLLVVTLVFISCAEEMITKPENLIPKEKMTAILYDLAIINAAKNTGPKILVNNNIESMPYIYTKYGIDSLQFVKSDIYYSSIPVTYQAIYKSVELKLEEKQEELEEAKKKKDSVAKALRKPTKIKTDTKD